MAAEGGFRSVAIGVFIIGLNQIAILKVLEGVVRM